MEEVAKAELRKLDFRIMQEILGFSLNCHGETHSLDPEYGQDYVCLDTDCLAEDEFDLNTPHERIPLEYSSNVSAAFEVVYHLKDYHFDLAKYAPKDMPILWEAKFTKVNDPLDLKVPAWPQQEVTAQGNTAALAICAAALLLSNYEKAH